MHYEWNDGDEVLTVLAVWGLSLAIIAKNAGDGWQADTLYRGRNGYIMNGDFSKHITDLLNKFPAGYHLQVLHYSACTERERVFITTWA